MSRDVETDADRIVRRLELINENLGIIADCLTDKEHLAGIKRALAEVEDNSNDSDACKLLRALVVKYGGTP
jgi:hypothetical protein